MNKIVFCLVLCALSLSAMGQKAKPEVSQNPFKSAEKPVMNGVHGKPPQANASGFAKEGERAAIMPQVPDMKRNEQTARNGDPKMTAAVMPANVKLGGKVDQKKPAGALDATVKGLKDKIKQPKESQQH